VKIFNYEEIKRDGIIRWLITGPNFDMRLLEIEENHGTPRSPHIHPWEHEIFIVEGDGVVWDGDKRSQFSKGDVIYIPPGEPYTFINLGKNTLRFICFIPSGVDLRKITPLIQ
jgi:quercetin dioxygenase-like cupin family protein